MGRANRPADDEVPDREFADFPPPFTPQKAGRSWLRPLAMCAGLGGIYGAALGAAIAVVPGAADVIGTAAIVLAFIGGVPVARSGFYFGMANRARFARAFIGAVAAICGAILGGFLATMILLALGAIMGAVGGWFFLQGRTAVQHGILMKFLGGISGVVLGMFLGAILWAVRLSPSAAVAGAAWGLSIGAITGPLLFLLFLFFQRTIRMAPHVQPGERPNCIDATFHG
jgi:hypothetical protein